MLCCNGGRAASVAIENEELALVIQYQQEQVATKCVWADHQSRAQTQEFANLTVELFAGQRGPEVQYKGMRIGVKVEKPDNYDGNKGKDLDTWLFQVREHLDLTVILAQGHVLYVAFLM